MIRLIDWMDRSWSFEAPIGAFPAVLERLRGTPARAEEMVAGIDDALLGERDGTAWSVKEHVGHLDDLHTLDVHRLDEFLAGVEVLSAADMTNRRTEEGGHRATPVSRILARFRTHREDLIARLDALTDEQVGSTSLHPRLRRPMRIIDWTFFVAEHDDHHLARARDVLRSVHAASGAR